MKRILSATIATIFLMTPSLCLSAYVIHLKDGREFIADRYWEEGDQIKFKLPNGELGVDKGLIKEIKESPDLSGKQKRAEKEPPIRVERLQVKETLDEPKRAEHSNEGATLEQKRTAEEDTEVVADETMLKDEDRYQKERKSLLEEKNGLEKAYDRAREAGDMPERIAVEKALEKIDERLSKLRDEQGK